MSSGEKTVVSLISALPIPVARPVAGLSVAHSDHLNSLVKVVEVAVAYATAIACARAVHTGRAAAAGRATAGLLVNPSLGTRVDALRALGAVSPDLTQVDLRLEVNAAAPLVRMVRGKEAPKRPRLDDLLRAITELRNDLAHWRRGNDEELAESLSGLLPLLLPTLCGGGVLVHIDSVELDAERAELFRGTRLMGAGPSRFDLGRPRKVPDGVKARPRTCALIDGAGLLPLAPFVRFANERVLVLEKWDERGAWLGDFASSAAAQVATSERHPLPPGWWLDGTPVRAEPPAAAAAAIEAEVEPTQPVVLVRQTPEPSAGRRRSTPPLVWTIALFSLAAPLALCAVGGAAWSVSSLLASQRSAQPQVGSPAAIAGTPTPAPRQSTEGWVPIPGSRVLIARYEASVADFAACARTGACSWSGVNARSIESELRASFCPAPGSDDATALRCVTPAQAQRLCGFLAARDGLVRGRIPTSDEWTRASGWAVQTRAPLELLNATPAPNLCDPLALDLDYCPAGSGRYDQYTTVGAVRAQEKGANGLVGMLGNVAELVKRIHGTPSELAGEPYAAMGCSFLSACDADSVLCRVADDATGAQWGVRCAAEPR